MLTLSNIKSNILNKQTYWLLAAFFAVRLLSWLARDWLIAQSLIVIVLIIILILLFKKNWHYSFQLLLAEYALGGVGHFFELNNLSLRSVLTIVFLVFYFSASINNKKLLQFPIRPIRALGIFAALLIIAAGIGFYRGNPVSLILQDLIPFVFLLLIFPAYQFLQISKNKIFLLRLIFVWLLASALWSLFNFVLFTGGWTIIHQPYYNWLRDFAMAKITEANPYFFRIVFPEHLLLVPVILLISTAWLKYKQNFYLYLLILSSAIMALNISRAYFLGLIIGLLLLKYQNNWLDWLKILCLNFLIILALFTAFNIISSSNTDTGWAILGLKFGGITAPQTEISSQNRMELLKPIAVMIKDAPLLGQGLGQSIITEKINTRHFDWGYFEMWIKWGLLGLLWSLTMLGLLSKKIWTKIKNQNIYLGILSGAVALAVINITTPALFHVFGILYFTLLLSWLYCPAPTK
jgi:hypothetical protein